jgi:hypothetical protein
MALIRGRSKKADFVHVYRDEQRLLHERIVTFTCRHSMLCGQNHDLYIAVIRGIAEPDCAAKNVQRVIAIF